MKITQFLPFLSILFVCSCNMNTKTFYVSPSGSDVNSGSIRRPFASFDKAEEAIRQFISGGVENHEIKVYFREGTYFFDKSIAIMGKEYSTGNNKIIFSSYKDEKPVFSAGRILTGWELGEGIIPGLPEIAKGKIWSTNIPDEVSGNIARFLGTDHAPLVNAVSEYFTSAESESISGKDFMGANYETPEDYSYVVFPENSLRDWNNLEDIEIIIRPHYGWVVNILPLKSIDTQKKIAYTTIPGTYFLTRLSGSGDDANPNLQVLNAIDYLDKPGEWVINSVEGKIFYWPEEEKPSNVYYPLLQELIRVEGNEKDGNILKNIIFKGITFAHGDRDTWDKDAIGLQHDWAIHDESDALLRFIDTEGCIVDNCTFNISGGGGVRFDFYSQENKVINCEFSNLGGIPLLLAGYGPGLKDVNKKNEIINNKIHDCGQSYLHSPGIFVWQSGGNRIAHNLIYNTPYTGIVISGPRPPFFNKMLGNRREITGTVQYDEIGNGNYKDWNSSSYHINDWDMLFPYLFAGNNTIEYNEIRDVMQHLDDGNAIYFSGTGYNNIVRNNYIHRTISPHRQTAIRADDYAKDITISENIIYKFARAGIVIKYDNYVINNYIIDYVPTEMVNGEKHYPLSFIRVSAWGPIKGGVAKRNICYQTVGISMPFVGFGIQPHMVKSLSELPKLSDCAIDSNVYYATGVNYSSKIQLEELWSQGVDSNSIVADPYFEGLEESGFKLKSNSPALKMGIKQINFDKIGLLKDNKKYN